MSRLAELGTCHRAAMSLAAAPKLDRAEAAPWPESRRVVAFGSKTCGSTSLQSGHFSSKRAGPLGELTLPACSSVFGVVCPKRPTRCRREKQLVHRRTCLRLTDRSGTKFSPALPALLGTRGADNPHSLGLRCAPSSGYKLGALSAPIGWLAATLIFRLPSSRA
jgi:hypothetical protein